MTQTSPETRSAQFLEQAHAAVRSRFPLLDLLEFSDVPGGCTRNLPTFVGLIASILESNDKPCCVVLPDYQDVALAVSVLVAVTKLRSEFPAMLRAHAATNFKVGEDLVLVHPNEFVYLYEGFFNPQFFKLKVIDRRDSRSLPVSEIARLEKTTRKRPKGQLNSDLGQSQPTVIGALLGLKTAINRNLLRNFVLVLGARKHLVEALERWTVQITLEGGPLRRPLRDEVPFGKVAEGGHLSFLDDYVAAGEPLIAVASKVEDLAARCASAPKFTKAVLIEEIEDLARDLQAYDSITETQRVVMLADDSQREATRELAARGCEVWRLSPDELLFGLPEDPRNIPLRQSIAKASIARHLVISGITCKEESLDHAATELKAATDGIKPDESGVIQELLYSMFRVLMFCVEYLGQDPSNFGTIAERLLQLTRSNLDRARVWLTPEARAHLGQAIEDMQVAIANLSTNGTTPKGTVLLENLRSHSNNKNGVAVLIARGDTNPEELANWLSKSGVPVGVYPFGALPTDTTFSRILVVSWPRSERFDRLVHQYATGHLGLLAYPFEEGWLDGYRKNYKRSISLGISRQRKMQLLGLPASDSLDEMAESQVQKSDVDSLKFELPSERFLMRRKVGATDHDREQHEEMVEAFYVDFAGSTFAYLTEGHELPVLNAYVSGEQVNPGKVPLRAAESLKVGDYVMFRESGDSDIIRFLAEDDVGKAAYQRLRATAGRWRVTLRKLGTTGEQVWNRLRPYALSRHPLTVKGWLTNESMICPKDPADLRIIASAAHDKELFQALPDVMRARDEIVSLHIRAGYRLTELLLKELPKKISALGQGETELDLGVGKVWVVRIEELDSSLTNQPRSQVNRLLWDVGAIWLG